MSGSGEIYGRTKDWPDRNYLVVAGILPTTAYCSGACSVLGISPIFLPFLSFPSWVSVDLTSSSSSTSLERSAACLGGPSWVGEIISMQIPLTQQSQTCTPLSRDRSRCLFSYSSYHVPRGLTFPDQLELELDLEQSVQTQAWLSK